MTVLFFNLYPATDPVDPLATKAARVDQAPAPPVPAPTCPITIGISDIVTYVAGGSHTRIDPTSQKLIIDIAVSVVDAMGDRAPAPDAAFRLSFSAFAGTTTVAAPVLPSAVGATLATLGTPTDVGWESSDGLTFGTLATMFVQKRADGIFRLHIMPNEDLWGHPEIRVSVFDYFVQVHNDALSDTMLAVAAVAVAPQDGGLAAEAPLLPHQWELPPAELPDIQGPLSQPWLHMASTISGADVLIDASPVAVGHLTLTNYGPGPAPATAAHFDITPATAPFSLGFSGTIAPFDSQEVSVTFNPAGVTPGPQAATLTALGDPSASAGDTLHDNQASLAANVLNALNIMLVLDGSGSMRLRPDGSVTPTVDDDSRWALLRDAADKFGSMVDMLTTAESLGTAIRVGAVIFQGSAVSSEFAIAHHPSAQSALSAFLTASPTGSTPMLAGVNRGLDLFAGTTGARFMLLMTDGHWNVPFGPTGDPAAPAVLARFTADGVVPHTVQYGPDAAVNVATLQAISAINGGQNHTVETGSDAELNLLMKTFEEVFRAVIGLEAAMDPPATVTTDEPVVVREFNVNALDSLVIVSVMWNTADRNRLNVELVSPLCEVLSVGAEPTGVLSGQGRRFTDFCLTDAYLQNDGGPARYGTWRVRVSLNNRDERFEREEFLYTVSTRSALSMSVDTNSPLTTGGVAKLAVRLAERGLPVRGAAVVAHARVPSKENKTQIAGIAISQEQLAAARERLLPLGITDFWSIKLDALRNAGHSLEVDLADVDLTLVESSPGLYSAELSLDYPGEYFLQVDAGGQLSPGVRFERQEPLTLSPLQRLDRSRTEVSFEVEGSSVNVCLRVKDALGTPILFDPASGAPFALVPHGADLSGELVARQDGTYCQRLRVSPTEPKPVLEVIPTAGAAFDIELPSVAQLIWTDRVVTASIKGEANKFSDAKAGVGRPDGKFVALGSFGSLTLTASQTLFEPSSVTIVVAGAEDPRAYRVEVCVISDEQTSSKIDAQCTWVEVGRSAFGVSKTFELGGIPGATPTVRVWDESGRSQGPRGPLSNPGVNVDAVGFAARPSRPTVPTVELSQLALAATQSLLLAPSTVVLESAGDFGAVGSAGTTDVWIEPHSQLGDLWSEGTVRLGDLVHVHGSIYAEKRVVLSTIPGHPNSPLIDGRVEHTALTLPDLTQFLVPFPTKVGADFDVGASGQTIRPGVYGEVRVGGRLVFAAAGKYYFTKLSVLAQGTLDIRSAEGHVEVYVDGEVTHWGQVVTHPGQANLLIVAFGDVRALAPARGTWVAPRGSLLLASASAPGHVGAFYARKLTTVAGCTVTHWPLTYKNPYGPFGRDVPVIAVLGVGEHVRDDLAKHGIHTIDELARLEPWQPLPSLRPQQHRDLVNKARVIRTTRLPQFAQVVADRTVTWLLSRSPEAIAQSLKGALSPQQVKDLQEPLARFEMALDPTRADVLSVRELTVAELL